MPGAGSVLAVPERPALTSSMKDSIAVNFSVRSPRRVLRALNSLKRSSNASDRGWILNRDAKSS